MKQYVLALGLALPLCAQAQGYLDVYYTASADIKVDSTLGSGDDEGDGFGLRALAPISDTAALTAEYQSNTYDDSNLDIDQLRLGLGIVGPTRSGVLVEYLDLDVDGDQADGFGIHLRLSGDPKQGLYFYGQAGYLMLQDDVEDIRGLEFSLGLAAPLGPTSHLFFDFRRSQLEGESSQDELEFSDLRLGLRLGF